MCEIYTYAGHLQLDNILGITLHNIQKMVKQTKHKIDTQKDKKKEKK